MRTRLAFCYLSQTRHAASLPSALPAWLMTLWVLVTVLSLLTHPLIDMVACAPTLPSLCTEGATAPGMPRPATACAVGHAALLLLFSSRPCLRSILSRTLPFPRPQATLCFLRPPLLPPR